MAEKSTYWELLRHPEWQKKRLKIMEREEFQCQDCSSKTTTLNVHHTYYTKGARPWEYPDESLRCLCESCHETRHKSTETIRQLLGDLSAEDLLVTMGFIRGVLLHARHLGEDDSYSKVPIATYAEAYGLSLARGTIFDEDPLNHNAVMAARDADGFVSSEAIDSLSMASAFWRKGLEQDATEGD